MDSRDVTDARGIRVLFLLLLGGGALLLSFIGRVVTIGPQVGNVLFVAWPLAAAAVASSVLNKRG